MLQTYEGVVERGKVRLPSGLQLPDGARVYVTIVPAIDERAARRKAARWLAENVGDMVMPGPATLIHETEQLVWRFPAMIGSPFRKAQGPVGHINVDAESGMVLSSPTLVDEIMHNVEHLKSPILSPGN